MLKTQTIQWKLTIGFVLGPLILAAIGWIIYLNTAELVRDLALQQHSHKVLEKTEVVGKLMADAEAGQRGYLITGADPYLAPYNAAFDNVDNAIAELAALTAGDPRQQARLQTLTDLTRQRFERLGETMTLRREQGLDAAIAVVLTGEGKSIMDDIHAVLAQIGSEENDLLEQRTAAAERAAKLTFNWITLGCFVLLAIVGILIGRSIVVPVAQAVDALASVSTEILAGTTQQAAGMREHSSAVTETVSTVDEVLQTSEQASQRAQAVSESSQRAAEVGQSGRKAVEESVLAMGTVKDQTSSIAESILTLAEQAQAIGEIIATVNDIAEQTNVLSLNAAIEASRAGEHGRGFSVVAGEVKVLADQSKKATGQVRQILGEIQKATNTAVMVTEQGTKSVNDAIKTVNDAGTTIRLLTDIITEAVQAAAQIAASSAQQATGMRQIHQAMQNISQVSTQNMAATNQAEQAARHLTVVGSSLRQLVTG